MKNATLMGQFITPPECQGQIVVVSYAPGDIDEEGYIIERQHDRSDGSTQYAAYRYPARGAFEPWNDVPNLGRFAGKVRVVERVRS